MSNDIHTGNRAARRAAGRHRRRSTKTAAATLVVATTALGVSTFLVGPAAAEPIQGGVTGDSSQEGVIGNAQPSGTTTEAPAPSVAEPKAESSFWVAPPAEYNQGTREYDSDTGGGVAVVDYSTDNSTGYNDGGGYSGYSGDGGAVEAAPAVNWSQLRAPTPVLDPTLPIEAPRDKMRMGRVVFDQPNWVSDIDADRTNNQTAVIEAQVTDAWRSVGLETSEAERIASAQVAGTAIGVGTGAAAGCAAVGVPTSLAAATVAGIGGALVGTMVPVPLVGTVTSGVAATAAGAAGGLGAGCAVGAVIGGGLGGAAGLAAGTAYGAGEDATPIEAEVPDVEAEKIDEQVDSTFEQWSQDPVGQVVVDSVQTFTTDTAPAMDTQVRDFVAAQPGGEQIVEQVDQGLEAFFNDATPGLAGNLISTAIGDGIAQFGI